MVHIGLISLPLPKEKQEFNNYDQQFAKSLSKRIGETMHI